MRLYKVFDIKFHGDLQMKIGKEHLPSLHSWARGIVDKADSITFVFLLLILLFIPSGCTTHRGSQNWDGSSLSFANFRDVPGITEEEIAAILALQETREYLVYGVSYSTEAFQTEDGEIGGFARLFAEWLSSFFEIEVRMRHYEFAHLIQALDEGVVDLGGGLLISEERRENYYLAGPVVERSFAYFRLKESPPFSHIRVGDISSVAFLRDSETIPMVLPTLPLEHLTIQYVPYIADVYQLLRNDAMDGFIHLSTARVYFEQMDDVVMDLFHPPLFASVAVLTKDSELAPLISVLQKSLTQEQLRYLTELHSQGEREYIRHTLWSRFTDEEKQFLQEQENISLAAKYSNYPVSFYNQHEGEWQGISFDILQEISLLTDLEFTIVNDVNTPRAELLEMLRRGEARMLSELTLQEGVREDFLWTDGRIMSDRPVLISDAAHHPIQLNEILYLDIGLVTDTVYGNLFQNWFPYANNIIEYSTEEAAFYGLIHNEVDMLMLSEASLLNLTNYREFPGYKANFTFQYDIHSAFGFHLDEELLRSIIDKSLEVIETEVIITRWMRKTFDYRALIWQAQLPWIISAVVLFAFVLVLLIVLLHRKTAENRRLWKIQRAVIGTIADLIESRDVTTGKHILNIQKYLQCLVKKCIESDVYKNELAKWNIDDLLLAAGMHDVGKITVSDAILNKPGALTKEEYEEIKKHTSTGVEMIKQMERLIGNHTFLESAKKFAGTHHEKWDGSGYPDGLKGEQIPLEGRLLAIVDVYDALVSVRPYKEAYSPEIARSMVLEKSGTDFDPKLIKVFIMLEDEFAAISRER